MFSILDSKCQNVDREILNLNYSLIYVASVYLCIFCSDLIVTCMYNLISHYKKENLQHHYITRY